VWDGRDDAGSIVPINMYTTAIWAYPVPINSVVTVGAA
jgi:hypothetical protein